MAARSRLPRVLRSAAKVLAWTLAALVVLVAAALLSINLPAVRRVAADRVTGLLSDVFRGSLVIEEIGFVSPFGVRGVRARVTDAEGRQVLLAVDLDARLSAFDVVRSVLAGEGDVIVDIENAGADYVDVSLDVDQEGIPRIARAFEPRESLASEPTAPAPSRGVRVAIARGEVRHAWIHGALGGFWLDADADELRAIVQVDGAGATAELSGGRITSRAFPRGADVQGAATGRVVVPSGEAPPGIRATFDGNAGGVPVKASAAWEGAELHGEVTVPKVPGPGLGRMLPEVDFTQDVDARVRVDGPFEALRFAADAHAGPGHVSVRGVARLGPGVTLSAHADVATVDLAAFGAELPSSSLGARADVVLEIPEQAAPTGSFEARVEEGRIAGADTPPASVRGVLDPDCLRVAGEVFEPGANARFEATVRDAGVGLAIDTNVVVRLPDLRSFARLGSIAQGKADLTANVRVDTASESVAGRVTAKVDGFSLPPVRFRRASAFVDVRGSLADPRMDATLTADGVVAAGRSFDRVAASAIGGPRASSVHATLTGADGAPDFTVHTMLALEPALSLKKTTIVAVNGPDRVMLAIDSASLDPVLTLDGVSLSGAGNTLSGELRFGGGAARVRASGVDVDLGTVARALGARRPARGRVDLDVDVKVDRRAAEGRVAVDLRDGALGKVTKVSASVDAELRQRDVLGSVRAKLGPGRVDIDTKDVRLGGPPLELESWERGTGTVELATDVDLERLRALLPDDLLPLDELTGRLVVRGALSRGAPGEPPSLDVSLRTESLHVAGKAGPSTRVDGTLVRGPPPWRSTDLDVDLEARVSGDGATEARLSVLDARQGVLATLDVNSTIPYRELTSSPSLLARLETVPFAATLTVPERRLLDFPAVFGARRSAGKVRAALAVDGTLVQPRADVTLALTDFVVTRRRGNLPIDARVSGHFAEGVGRVDAEADCGGARALGGVATVQVEPRELLHRAAHPRWTGTAAVDLSDFPLRAIPALDDRRIRGRVDGSVRAAAGSDRRPEATIALDARRLAVGESRRNAVRLRASIDDKAARAEVSIAQEAGSLSAKADVALGWRGVVPNPERANLSLRAKAFRTTLLAPLLETIVKEVDGRVDADLAVEIDRAGRKAKFRGDLALRDGAFQLPTVGEEFRNVEARVVLEPGGIIRLRHASGHGATGRFSGEAVARFSGFDFQGARAELHVPKRAPLPVVVEGETLAEAWADVTVDARPRERGGLDVVVRVPRAGAELPPRSTHAVQSLAPADGIRVGTQRTPEEFLVLPLGPKAKPPESAGGERLRVVTELHDVEVTRESELRVRLSGKLRIEPEDPVRVEGRIRFASGFIDVQGKRFEIEQGTATFLGDPENPEVVVTAGWTAPEGTRVYADFVGPLRTGRVSLRSEPSHTKNEILSLILFGSPDGGSPGGTAGSAGTSAAVGLGGGVATQGLNRALDDLTGLEVTTRVDTTESANPRPEVEVRIARDVSLAISHALGVPPPGTRPDRNFATLDWRFSRNWSLETTFGDAGSSVVDVVWQYRY